MGLAAGRRDAEELCETAFGAGHEDDATTKNEIENVVGEGQGFERSVDDGNCWTRRQLCERRTEEFRVQSIEVDGIDALEQPDSRSSTHRYRTRIEGAPAKLDCRQKDPLRDVYEPARRVAARIVLPDLRLFDCLGCVAKAAVRGVPGGKLLVGYHRGATTGAGADGISVGKIGKCSISAESKGRYSRAAQRRDGWRGETTKDRRAGLEPGIDDLFGVLADAVSAPTAARARSGRHRYREMARRRARRRLRCGNRAGRDIGTASPVPTAAMSQFSGNRWCGAREGSGWQGVKCSNSSISRSRDRGEPNPMSKTSSGVKSGSVGATKIIRRTQAAISWGRRRATRWRTVGACTLWSFVRRAARRRAAQTPPVSGSYSRSRSSIASRFSAQGAQLHSLALSQGGSSCANLRSTER